MSSKTSKLAGAAFLIRLTSAAVTYCFVIIMARIMGTADFGIVATIMSAALLFSIVGSVGQQYALLRFVPPLLGDRYPRTDESQGAIDSLDGRSFRLMLLGNVIVFAILLTVVNVSPLNIAPSQIWLVGLGLLIVPMVSVIDFQAHLARAYKSIVIALLPKEILWRLLTFLILGGVYLATDQDVSLQQALITLIVILGALILGQNILMRRRLNTPGLVHQLSKRTPSDDATDWKRARVPFWIVSITAVAFTNIDVVAVGTLIGPEAAALYFVANRLSAVPQLFGNSFNIVIGPMFSRYFSENNHDALKQTAQTATLQVTVFTILAVVVLWVGAPLILRLFGPEYIEVMTPLRILLASTVVNTLFGSNDLLLSMCGKEKTAMRNGAISTGIGLILIVAGALTGSLMNLAIGVSCAILFARLLSWSSVVRELGFSADFGSAVFSKTKGFKN